MSLETGLSGKVVIVTGAAAGIGHATALAFARQACTVAAWDVNDKDGDALVAELRSVGGDGAFFKVSVTDAAAVSSAVDAIVDRFGRVDVLVNNAGVVRDSQLVKWKDGAAVATMSDDAWNAVLDVNLKGVFNGTRAVVPHMIARASGVILSTSSVVGLYGNFGQTNYVASKAGVIGMTRVWARELGRYGIRVNAVAPGFIATEILASMPPKVIESMVGHTPLGRMGRPDDVASAFVWLASDAASFVTGSVISVDGGLVVGT
jgi:3-oxoacyl-[acyl-carrier protein] reductase